MKRINCIFLALLLLIGVWTSCGETVSQKETAVNTDELTDSTAPVEADPLAVFEGLDFDGYEFTFLSYDTAAGWNLYLLADEQNGELVNDAAYRRNIEVVNLLNCTFSGKFSSEYETLFRNSVAAGEGEEYDLVCFWAPGERSSYITDNLLYNWKDIPYVNLDADWYVQGANEAYTIAGKQYFCVSDITFAGQQNASVLFNIGMVEDYGLESPYKLVDSGKWTIDTMQSYIKNIYGDLNSDGTRDASDRFGLVGPASLFGRFSTCSGEPEVISGDKGFEINLYSEKIVSLVEKILSITSMDDVFFGDSFTLFDKGNTMFVLYASDPARLRAIEFDFGYLPYPKYDESQENYITSATGGNMAVPICAANIERSGAIIEALSYLSHKYIVDAFVEMYVENKILRDEESVKNYRLTRNTYAYNICYNIDPAKLLSAHAYYSALINDSSLNIASYYETIRGKVENAYSELYNSVSENHDAASD